METKKKIIYVVGDCGPEHNSIFCIHETFKEASKSWNKLRRELLRQAKYHMKRSDKFSREMFERTVKNLSCKNYKLIDNYPHETPYIHEYELKK